MPELLAGDAEPRVNGVDGDGQRLGDLGHGEVVQVVHDEHLSALWADPVERCEHESSVLFRRDFFVGERPPVSGVDGGCWVHLSVMTREASMSGSRARADAEKPELKGPCLIEGFELPMNDDEDVLRDVLDVTLANAESS